MHTCIKPPNIAPTPNPCQNLAFQLLRNTRWWKRDPNDISGDRLGQCDGLQPMTCRPSYSSLHSRSEKLAPSVVCRSRRFVLFCFVLFVLFLFCFIFCFCSGLLVSYVLDSNAACLFFLLVSYVLDSHTACQEYLSDGPTQAVLLTATQDRRCRSTLLSHPVRSTLLSHPVTVY